MSDKDYSQLTSATTAADADVLAIYPSGGPLKKLTFLTFKNLVISALTGTYLTVANNLSDLASASNARANLGLGSIATMASSAFFQVANNLSEVANAATARANIGAAASDAPTITGGMTFSGQTKGNIQAVASTSISVSTAEYFTKSISANTTFTFDNVTASKAQAFILELTVSSNAVPTWPTVRWESGATPSFPNGTHLVLFVYNGSAWTGAVIAFSVA